jgi:hypothetical protein
VQADHHVTVTAYGLVLDELEPATQAEGLAQAMHIDESAEATLAARLQEDPCPISHS